MMKNGGAMEINVNFSKCSLTIWRCDKMAANTRTNLKDTSLEKCPDFIQ